MLFTALESDVSLTKRYTVAGSEPYPHVLNFTSHQFEASSLQRFMLKLEAHASEGHCLLKGNVSRPLINEPRRGTTSSTDDTEWVCIDVDGVGGVALEDLLASINFNADYVYQASASSGFKPGIRAHLFFFLDRPVSPGYLKLWLKHLNLTSPYLKANLKLNAACTSLRWGLDISTCQNDKLIYIAPPILDGVEDPHTGPRLKFVKQAVRKLSVPSDVNASIVTALETKHINECRTSVGLSSRPRRTKLVADQEVLVLDGISAVVTGEKHERGFVYLNLNNGDSWGYYYPENDPKILYNFKGEPNVVLRELCPDYTPKSKEPVFQAQEQQASGYHYLALLNTRDDQYYVGTYDEETKELSLRATSTVKKVQDFLKAHGQPVPEFIPEWLVEYDFQSEFVVDFEHRFINLYRMSPYMRNTKSRPLPPPFIHEIVSHVFANTPSAVEQFYNWLAVVCQKRIKTMTAWVVSGTQGTGKGLLFHRVLAPIIGEDYCQSVQLRAFEKEFNLFAESSLLLLINESEISASEHNRHQVMASLKELITDPIIAVRKMRTDHYRAKNSVNIIMASNKNDSVEVDDEDRRFSVAPRQETKFEYPKTEIESRIETELQDFADYIMNREADENLAATVYQSEEREKLKALTQDAPNQTAQAVKKGDIDFFWNNRPENENKLQFELLTGLDCESYAEILDLMFQSEGTTTNVPRNWLAVLFYYTSGNYFRTPHKFTKFIGHKGLSIQSVGHQDKIVRGVYGVQWKASPSIRAEWEASKVSTKIRRVK
jgi:hypothetical protein